MLVAVENWKGLHLSLFSMAMMDASRTVALVGRPNVGKSRLFNRLCGQRTSIVHDLPGVTRDLIPAEVRNDYRLLDTGGIGMELEGTPKEIAQAVGEQVEFAIQTARLILFVVDVRSGVTPLDEMLAEKFRCYDKSLLLVANKVDSEKEEATAGEFARLGLGLPILVSAEHGRGMDFLENVLIEKLGPKPPSQLGPSKHLVRIALAGRPNVGKSSLGNALLKDNQLIVSDVPGTTRDAVELDLEYPKDGEVIHFRLADTAGLRARRKVDSPVEYFSSVRTRQAIEHADVVFLVVDAADGVTKQDQAIAGEIVEAGKAIVVVVNKYDKIQARWHEEPVAGFKHLKHFLATYEASLRKQLFFLPDPPVVFVSALQDFRAGPLLEAAAGIEAGLDLQLPTGPLNRVIHGMLEARAPRLVGIKRFKIFYAVQTGMRPFRFRLYCNRKERLDPTYRRYLEKGLAHAFQIKGCPIRFDLVGKEKRYIQDEGNAPPRQGREIQDKHRLQKQGDSAFQRKPRKSIHQYKADHNQSRRKI